MMEKPIIHIENISKSFSKKEVLRKFSLNIEQGNIACVIGRSGSGKSVLLKCITGLMNIDNGKIDLFNEDINELSEDGLNRIRRQIGFVFQGSALYDSLNVEENLSFALTRNFPKMTIAEIRIEIEKALDSVGLKNTINLFPSELSGGMQKRIAIARAIVMKPRIILFDEPTAGLDIITSREISRLILKIQKEFLSTMIIITHDLECIRILNQIVVILNNGINHWQGTYGEMKNSKDPMIKEYLDPDE